MKNNSFNPEADNTVGPKLSEIVAEVDGNIKDKKDKNKESSTMKLLCFNIDMTYPRTIPGFIHIVQLCLLAVALISLIATSAWPDIATYVFYCLFLAFGCIVSGYFLFRILVGSRGEDLCGISWNLLELVYFCSFGFLIFIGACLAANKSEGNSGLNASAVFGFFSIITYGYFIWYTWQKRKAMQKEQNESKSEYEEENQKEEKKADELSKVNVNIPSLDSEESSKHRRKWKHNSLPMEFNEGDLYIITNPDVGIDTSRLQRKPYSHSEKYSAYIEEDGNDSSPARIKRSPLKLRRKGSPYEEEFNHSKKIIEVDSVLNKQPLAHISRRFDPFCGGSNSSERLPVGYPRQLNHKDQPYVNTSFPY